LSKDFFAALGGARVFGEGPGFEKNCCGTVKNLVRETVV
jgi:hypothetical protein